MVTAALLLPGIGAALAAEPGVLAWVAAVLAAITGLWLHITYPLRDAAIEAAVLHGAGTP